MKLFTRLSLIFCFMCGYASAGYAQSELGLTAAGGRLGFVDPDGVDATLTLDAMADLGTVADQLRLEVRAGYWSKSFSVGSVRDFIIGSSVHYMFEVSDKRFEPYAGGGLSLHFLNSKQDVAIPGIADGGISSTELGIDLIGGVLYGLNDTTRLNGTLTYTLGDAGQLAIKAGVLFSLQR